MNIRESAEDLITTVEGILKNSYNYDRKEIQEAHTELLRLANLDYEEINFQTKYLIFEVARKLKKTLNRGY